MADNDTVKRIKEELAKIPDLPQKDVDILTSKEIIDRVAPILTAQTKVNVEQVRQHKDLTTEAMRLLAEKITKQETPSTNIKQLVRDASEGIIDASAIDSIIDDLSTNWFWGPIMAVIFGAAHVGTSVWNILTVSSEKTKQSIQEKIRPYLLDINTLARMFYRSSENYQTVLNNTRKMGLSDPSALFFLDNAKTFPDVGTLARLWHRGEITEDQFNQGLRDLMYDENTLQMIKPALFDYPTASDLVRFAVREVFSPELAESLGLFSDMPEEFLTEAKKAGLPEDYARMHWGAHWNPIPPNMAIEAFQRGFIDFEALQDMMRINDIMPNHRELITNLAYNVPTRVDIRRIYQAGMIDYEQLYNFQLDLGNSPEIAEMMADWIDLTYGEDRKELAKTDILKLYTLGEYTRQETFDKLKSLRYSDSAAEDLILKVELAESEKYYAKLTSKLKKAYIKQTLAKEDIQSQLFNEQFTDTEINELFDDWDTEITSKITHLTKAELKELLKQGFMEVEEVSDYLTQLSYTPGDIEKLLALWTTEKETIEKKLTKEDIQKLYTNKIWDYEKSRVYMVNLGYLKDDIDGLFLLWEKIGSS